MIQKQRREVLKPNQYLPLQNLDLKSSVSNRKSTRGVFGSMVLDANVTSPTGSITNKVLSVRNLRYTGLQCIENNGLSRKHSKEDVSST